MAIRLIIRLNGAAPDAPPLASRLFDEPIVTIGNDPVATLRLEDSAVAPEQAIIINEDGQHLFINRAPGTLLNGEPLAREVRRTLSDGDQLSLGPFVVLVVLDETRAASPTQPRAYGQSPPPTSPAPPYSNKPPAAGNQPSPAPEETPRRSSFAAVLDSLRTEEDSFYFHVENGYAGRHRVAVESSEMIIGWDETGRIITCDAARVVAPRAVARKDWSGVLVQPYAAGMVFVNGEAVESVRRLRNGDRVQLLPTPAVADPSLHFLIFHEPASLVVLDALLPQQLPPPVAPVQTPPPPAEPSQALAPTVPAPLAPPTPPRAGLLAPNRRYFGYFTLGEVAVMFVGTLVAAVVIFLILEYT
ncbi:MAG TPA: FHA domain-containing protein [Pyrinomonadaceae bacterium]|nr:FHA domain-containing protein [Pyrinomonadaceae bacterium]